MFTISLIIEWFLFIMHKVVIVTFNRSNEMFFMHELKLIQDRREALRRQEDEILANENAHHSRAEMEHRKKIINNFGTDSSVWRSMVHRPWMKECPSFGRTLFPEAVKFSSFEKIYPKFYS